MPTPREIEPAPPPHMCRRATPPALALRLALASLLSVCWAGSASESIVIEQNVDTDYDCCELYDKFHPIVFPGGAPGRPDTAPADNLTKCIEICSSLFHSDPPCKAAAWNGPSKQCYLKSGKANPMHRLGDISFLLGVGPTTVPIAPGVNQPFVNLGGVTGTHASNWTGE